MVASDQPNLNRGWANASWEERNKIVEEHTYFEMGTFYYLANDLKVPESIHQLPKVRTVQRRVPGVWKHPAAAVRAHIQPPGWRLCDDSEQHLRTQGEPVHRAGRLVV